MVIEKNISLKPFNTFGIDVKAQFLANIDSISALDEIYRRAEFIPLPKFILGSGSNIIFTKSQRKLILKIDIKGISQVAEKGNDVWIKVGAGEIWHQMVLWCIDHDLGGVENLSLIPGTIGAAPIKNIGAYGVELSDVFDSLEAFEIKSGKILRFNKSQCQFGYRESVFKGIYSGQFIITSVTLKLTKKPKLNIAYGAIQATLDSMGKELNIRNVSDAVIHIRQTKLPDPGQLGNAGSFFKNTIIELPLYEALKEIYHELPSFPVDDVSIKIPAAWLIAQCGWKGKKFDRIGVHEHQPLVLVNFGGGTGQEILKLSEKIKSSIQKKFGIDLIREVQVF